MENNNLSLLDRLKAPTPNLFKKIRNIGICLAAVGGAIIAAPVTLPAVAITIAGYLTVAGSIMTAVSQATVSSE